MDAPWRLAQAVGLVATAVLLAGLFFSPTTSLEILWNVVIPLVPASLLISPMLWRNTCPLASLNMLSNGWGSRRDATRRLLEGSNFLGIALLAILVPARRFLFNADGPALAVTILAVAAGAVVLGAIFDMKAGFCNALCPVLPVERLYGQRPLVAIGNPRCPSCSGCSGGCIDLAPEKSVLQVLGRSRRSSAWLRSPFGVFAAAFPGFVLGYFTTQDSALSAAGPIYLWIAGWAAASYAIVWLTSRGLGIPAARLLPSLAAAAAGLYYWFAAPTLAATLGLPAPVGVALRAAALVFVGAWWWRTRSPGLVVQ